MKPLVSVVMPAWNAGNTIADSIDSVLAQSLKDWELVVVDDGSTDETRKILQGFVRADPRISMVSLTQNLGPARARNIAIEASKGRFIGFLDADDLWHPEKLERQVRFMLKKKVGLTYGAYRVRRSDLNEKLFTPPSSVSYQSLLKTCPIGCSTAMYDTRHYGKVYMPDLRKRQDYALWLRLLKNGGIALKVPGTLSTYKVTEGSVSRSKWKAAMYQWRIYRRTEMLGVLASSYYFAHYAVNGIFKYR